MSPGYLWRTPFINPEHALTDPTESSDLVVPVPYREAARVWAKVGLLSFGGPAGQIATMHRLIVDELRWVSEPRFLDALNFCNLLPGPEAQQLATYLGWLQHGVKGALTAGGLFILPGFVALLLLSTIYVTAGHLPLVEAAFGGLKPAVLAVVLTAVIRIGRRSLATRWAVALAIGAFVALFVFRVPFPVVVLVAGLAGVALGARIAPRARPATAIQRPSYRGSLRTAAIGLLIWWLPLAAIGAWFGPTHVFATEGVFFSQTALVTFGGAYAVLAYVSDQAVNRFHWVAPAEMIDGLALAETTPGPLILVLQFVGFLAGYRLGAPVAGWWGGLLGSLVTVWATFAPSFTLVLIGAPYLEWLRGLRRLQTALAAITAAVVGVVANLGFWFAARVLFREQQIGRFGPVAVEVPVIGSVDWIAAAIAVAALLALTKGRIGMIPTLAGAALLGIVVRLAS